MEENSSELNTIELATELTIAWLSNPNTTVSADEVSGVLAKMHAAVINLASPTTAATEAEPAAEFVPAVSVRRSLASKDHLISLIDGKPYKTLRRHLAGHGLTPEQYRERYNLKPDYPMVSEGYSQVRRDMAKKIGLGRKPGKTVAKRKAAAKPAAPKSAPTAPKRQPRAKKAAAAPA